MKYSLILLAGGKGERFGSTIPKPFMSLNGKAVIQYSLDVIEPLVDEVIIVSSKKYKDYITAKPGKTRGQSVQNALKKVTGDFVIIHDSVRPFVTTKQIEEIKSLVPIHMVVDTVTPIVDGYINGVRPEGKGDRKLGLTPEGFETVLLRSCFDSAKEEYQDEVTMVYDIMGMSAKQIEGTSFNSKLTYESDLAYAEGIMRFWSKPITTEPNLDKFMLILGGSGDIGRCCSKQTKSHCPTRKEVDLSSDWTIALDEYDSIIHSAGEYADKNKIMKVNFDSCVKLIELAEEQDWKGNIVFLSSAAATYGRKGIALYSASKIALNAYVESRHEELSEKGIYVNVIAPAKVVGQLQESINPDADKNLMLTPEYVAEYILRYTDTKAHGDIIYLRVGLDK